MGKYSQTPLRERFGLQHSKSNGCWEWTGRLSAAGYGQIKDHYRTRNAHRVSWELHFGAIPVGLLVCHSCDNRKCVNPEHLFLGTNKDNASDMVAKDRHFSRRAENHNKAKLNWAAVKEIRASSEDARLVARRLGMSFSTIYRIRRGDLWRQG